VEARLQQGTVLSPWFWVIRSILKRNTRFSKEK